MLTWDDVFLIPRLAQGVVQTVAEGCCRQALIIELQRDGQLVHITHENGVLTVPASWPIQLTKSGAVAIIFPPGMPEGFLLLIPDGCGCRTTTCPIDPELLCYDIDDITIDR